MTTWALNYNKKCILRCAVDHLISNNIKSDSFGKDITCPATQILWQVLYYTITRVDVSRLSCFYSSIACLSKCSSIYGS